MTNWATRRPLHRLKLCLRRKGCVSPRGHWGPCHMLVSGRLEFVDARGQVLVQLRARPPRKLR